MTNVRLYRCTHAVNVFVPTKDNPFTTHTSTTSTNSRVRHGMHQIQYVSDKTDTNARVLCGTT